MPKDLSFIQTELTADVRADEDGLRLDRFLRRRFYWRSRTYFQDMIDHGMVSIDGRPEKKASRRVRTGQCVMVPVPESERQYARSEDIPLNIVYEDDYLVIINKQPHLVVHPNAKYPFGTLLNAVFYHYRHRTGADSEITPRLVHRIDQFTSGLIMVAKDEDVHRELQRQFREREVKKEYKTIVHGSVEGDGKIDTPIGLESGGNLSRGVVEDGRPSLTYYQVEENFGDYSYLRVQIKTGRTHQIRVHMSSIGHPIIGDERYGGKGEIWLSDIFENEPEKDRLLISRQALHSYFVSFYHPALKKEIEVSAEPPEDMRQVLGFLRLAKKQRLGE